MTHSINKTERDPCLGVLVFLPWACGRGGHMAVLLSVRLAQILGQNLKKIKKKNVQLPVYNHDEINFPIKIICTNCPFLVFSELVYDEVVSFKPPDIESDDMETMG